jgi:hypothetical protein
MNPKPGYNRMTYLSLFFAGAFLCNCIPHLAAGLQGQPFPTPFATPRGVGNSPPLVNFLWGAFNLCAGLVLLTRQTITVGANLNCLALLAGALALGLYLSRHFGKVMEARRGG